MECPTFGGGIKASELFWYEIKYFVKHKNSFSLVITFP